MGPAFVLVWVTIVFAGYYAVHKPLPAGDLGAWALLAQPLAGVPLLGAALDLAVAAWLMAISVGIGHAVLRLLGIQPDGVAAIVAFSLGLGFGVLGLAFLALGVIGFLAPVPAFFLLGASTGVGLLEAHRIPRWVGARPRLTRNRLHLALAILIGITALLTLTRALTPPLAWDAFVYHLTGPKRYIEAGAIIGGIDIPHVYFPSLVEQLFTAAMLIRGDIAAQLTHFALAVTAVLAVFAFLDRREGRRAAWLGAALLATTPSLVSLARIPYVEWGMIAFGFLSFWALREALDRWSGRWLLLSGALAGFALGTKYTAAFLVLGLALALVWEARRMWPLVIWSGAVAAASAPWFLRNLVLTGNAVYPFAFGGWNWDAWKADWFSRAGTGLLNEPWRLLIAPWDLTVLSGEGGGAYDVDLGPLFLALLPLLLVARAKSSWMSFALIVCLCAYAAWLLGAAQSSLLPQGRLLLPLLPFLACLIATGLCHSERSEERESVLSSRMGVRVARVLYAAVLLALILSVASYTFRWVADPPLPYLLRAESRTAFLERHLGEHYRAMDFLNRQGARALFLWEPRSYYCNGECQPDALLFNWRYLLHRHGNAEGAMTSMRADGYTHLLLYGGGLRFFSQGPRPEVEPEHIAPLIELESRYLDRLYGPPLTEVLEAPMESVVGRAYAVYRLR